MHTYVRPAVKTEAGAKSALDPHTGLTILPYVSGEAKAFDLAVPNVMTVDPLRTFWDKVLILHNLRHSFDEKGRLRGGGQRISRHFYDVDHSRLTSRQIGSMLIFGQIRAFEGPDF